MIEKATNELRYIEAYNDEDVAFVGENRYGVHVRYKLQQKWEITENGLVRYEWRDVGVSYD